MTNVCLIGISHFGAVHYGDLMRAATRGEVSIRAATVINQPDEPEKCQRLRELGCELFTDYREMLATHGREVDLCFIPTGIHQHAPMTIDALRAGCNVFVEKPAAAVIQDVRAMQQAERDTGRFVAVGFQNIYSAATAWMKQVIASGRLGQLRSLKIRGIWPRPDSYYARNNWAGRIRSGEKWILDAPFHNAFAHELNLLGYLAGQPLAHVQAELYRLRDIESPDTACIRIHTAEGVPLLLLVTHAANVDADPEMIITGTRDTLRWQYNQSARLDSGETATYESREELRDRMIQMVCRRVTDPRQFICNLSIAANEVLCANGAFASSPVRPLPAGTDVTPWILRGFDEGKLFSELGASWAQPGTIVALTGFDRYPPS